MNTPTWTTRPLQVVGLDLSLTATGVADPDGSTRTLKVALPEKASEYQRVERLHDLSARVDVACRGADIVVIEGYGFQAKHSPGHSLGELGGIVKVILYQRRIPFAIVTPNQLKKLATGKGNAPKDEVFRSAIKRGSECRNHNEGDAYWLREAALIAYHDVKRMVVPSRNEEAVWQIAWPQLEWKETAVVAN